MLFYYLNSGYSYLDGENISAYIFFRYTKATVKLGLDKMDFGDPLQYCYRGVRFSLAERGMFKQVKLSEEA